MFMAEGVLLGAQRVQAKGELVEDRGAQLWEAHVSPRTRKEGGSPLDEGR